jgi:hypothetical protein
MPQPVIESTMPHPANETAMRHRVIQAPIIIPRQIHTCSTP